MSFRRIAFLAAALFVAACGSTTGAQAVQTAPVPITREMRGLWVATVNNGDWPSKNSLTPDQQRAELIDILDKVAATGFNAIVFQVRPAGDAVYPSSI